MTTPPTPGMRVQLDPVQLAKMGISEAITVDLPQGFATFSPAQRRAWARREIEGTALAMLRDIGMLQGTVPTPAQEAAYLHAIAPGIEEALEGIGR